MTTFPKKIRRRYQYVHICVTNSRGIASTVSVSEPAWMRMVELARGSSADPIRRVAAVCREAANEVKRRSYARTFSAAVRRLALKKLAGAFDDKRACEYDSQLFPDGIKSTP